MCYRHHTKKSLDAGQPIWYALDSIGLLRSSNMLPTIQLDSAAETPIYRQLYARIKSAILNQEIGRGERLPPTRELAGLLGLNRTTVSAAYELLEAEGLIRGHVGRGSYVEGPAATTASEERLDWQALMPSGDSAPATPAPATAAIIPSASRPRGPPKCSSRWTNSASPAAKSSIQTKPPKFSSSAPPAVTGPSALSFGTSPPTRHRRSRRRSLNH